MLKSSHHGLWLRPLWEIRSPVASCYCPANVSPVEQFYKDMSTLLSQIPPYNILLVGGDFNAKLSTKVVCFSYHDETNRNGEMLLDFLAEYNLVPTNTQFEKARRKIWTHKYSNGTKAQLDYILCRRKWVNSVVNVEPYLGTFIGIGFDHKRLSMQFQLSLGAPRVVIRRYRVLNYTSLGSNDCLCIQLEIEVKIDLTHLCQMKVP